MVNGPAMGALWTIVFELGMIIGILLWRAIH
jgi:hypothetical protein